jgi:hypothetical protein
MSGAGTTAKVRYGRAFTISGRVSPGVANRTVQLERADAGEDYAAVASARTAADGSYRFTVRPRSSGSYRAVSEGSAASPQRVTVIAALSARARRHVLGTRPVRLRGRLLPALAERKVALQVRSRGGWSTVDRARTGRGGRFVAAWRPRRVGVYRLRVRFTGDRSAAASTSRSQRVHVYRAGHASWYGPGLYGNGTACGGALTPSRLGVAHKSLPCGTRVTFRYRGRSVTVRVIDRGPFIAGREWDLTAATKQRLGFGSTGTVWSTR